MKIRLRLDPYVRSAAPDADTLTHAVVTVLNSVPLFPEPHALEVTLVTSPKLFDRLHCTKAPGPNSSMHLASHLCAALAHVGLAGFTHDRVPETHENLRDLLLTHPAGHHRPGCPCFGCKGPKTLTLAEDAERDWPKRKAEILARRPMKAAPSRRSIDLAAKAVKGCEDLELSLGREVALPEGGIILYFFSGTPSAEGSHPRRVGIVADNDDDYLSVFMSAKGQPDQYFDVEDGKLEGALARIAKFLGEDPKR